MEHYEGVIHRDVHVQLYAVAYARRVLKGGNGIFRCALVYAVQAAVGKIAAHKRGPLLFVLLPGRHQEGSRSQSRGDGSGGDKAGPGGFI